MTASALHVRSFAESDTRLANERLLLAATVIALAVTVLGVSMVALFADSAALAIFTGLFTVMVVLGSLTKGVNLLAESR